LSSIVYRDIIKKTKLPSRKKRIRVGLKNISLRMGSMMEFANPQDNVWKRENRKLLISTPIFDLVTHDVTPTSKAFTKPFYVLEAKPWVNTIAITPEKNILLIRQYRHGLHEYCLELPGGIVDDTGDDATLLSAKRELVEETGYTSNNWKFIGKVSGNPAVFNNYSYTYLALDATKTQDTSWDEAEEIEEILVPEDKIIDLLRNGNIHHSMMVASLSLYLIHEKF
jgi:ADP-ribose pyrophosphatase